MNIIQKIKAYFAKPVPQGGFIAMPPRETDRLFTGATQLIPIDWTKYSIIGEKQANMFVFDTMACTTFSFLNSIEMQLKRLQEIGELSDLHIKFLKSNGYYNENNEVDFSDKFTAITSGTMRNGNTFQNVGNAARNIGLIPNSLLPFGNEKKWEDWHNPSQISQFMRNLAEEFKKYFEITYEHVFLTDNGTINSGQRILAQNALAASPLQIAIPFPAYHAIVMTKLNDTDYNIFDSYDPYARVNKMTTGIHYAQKPTIIPKYPVVKLGAQGEQVKQIQTCLGIVSDGRFGPATEKAVKDYQSKNGLSPDGVVGKVTASKLMKPTVTIIRKTTSPVTQGNLTAYNNGKSFSCVTLELPWKDNADNISCIPPGVYDVKWTYSPLFKRFTYEVLNVPNRDGIRFHVANFIKDLLGCIGLGKTFADMNNDGKMDITSSTITVKEFEAFFNKEAFTLIIK